MGKRLDEAYRKLSEVESEYNIIRSKLLADYEREKANLTIKCKACNGLHKIKDLTAIQTFWYERPHGCMGGDYWVDGELDFLCPDYPYARNRILFMESYKIPWGERSNFKYNAQEQFKRKYSGLFKEVLDGRDDTVDKEGVTRKWQDLGFWNNEYVDQNRKKFGLVVIDDEGKIVKEHTN